MPEREVFSTIVYDNSRWEGFEFRPDDIVISTPPKCGTTWTQMIVALLLFQTPDLPAPLAKLSPWLDMRTRSRKEVFADLAAQTHRRFIKTHTPLSGLPVAEGVTYICVARDPRDVALSMSDHMSNLDFGRMIALNAAAAEADGLDAPPVPMPPPTDLDQSPQAQFWRWVLDDSPVGAASSSLPRTVGHVQTFWDERDREHVVLVHYQDLKDDLEGEMRRLADRLGIGVPEDRWPALVHAAGFESMRRQASITAPNTDAGFWLDTTAFFRRGRSGAWREILRNDVEIRRYQERVATLGPPDLLEWLHRS
ncbi:MAG: sulfotransferase domain-containing protein [Acidimicrobiales bacterium]|nr:sulfotransferase domain-containing protein [Acidimicrobiales bacterium]